MALNITNFSTRGDTIVLRKNDKIQIDIFYKKNYFPNYCSDSNIELGKNVKIQKLFCESGILVINKIKDSIKIQLINCSFKSLRKEIFITNEIIQTKIRPNAG